MQFEKIKYTNYYLAIHLGTFWTDTLFFTILQQPRDGAVQRLHLHLTSLSNITTNFTIIHMKFI